MSGCDSQLDAMIAWERGPTGYLSYQNRMDRVVIDELRPILDRSESELELAFVNIFAAAKFAVASELETREHERTDLLSGRARETSFFGSAVTFNSQASKAAERARRLVRELPDSVNGLEFPGDDVMSDARDAFFQSMIEFNVLPVEFEELLTIWDQVAEQAREGSRGILAQLDENLETFVRLRAQPDRGNSAHSPLPWWKYVVIALVIGAAVFAVIACFWWTACTWVWPAISAVAPWIFGMIDRGC
jgi:hypothetical protein